MKYIYFLCLFKLTQINTIYNDYLKNILFIIFYIYFFFKFKKMEQTEKDLLNPNFFPNKIKSKEEITSQLKV